MRANPQRLFAVAACASLFMLSHASEARACSGCGAIGILAGEPADGATDVPTNAAPWVRIMGGDVELIGPDGEPVELETDTLEGTREAGQCRSRFVELRPKVHLEPNSRYELRDDTNANESRSFTTGSRAMEASEPTPPNVELAVRSTPADEYCGQEIPACVGTRESGSVEITVFDADGMRERYLADHPAPVTALPGVCLELRRRDILGERSEPFSFCVDDVDDEAHLSASLDEPWGARCDLGSERLPVHVRGAETADRPARAASCQATPGIGSVGAFAPLFWLMALRMRRRGPSPAPRRGEREPVRE